MFTQIKLSKQWSQSPNNQKVETQHFSQQFLGYDFLKNIWTNYFSGRQNILIQDKLDRINKVVNMVKSQIKILTINEMKQRQSTQSKHVSDFDNRQIEDKLSLQLQHNKIKQAYQQSQVKIQQLAAFLQTKEEQISKLQKNNYELKQQFFEMKKAKNGCEETIIELSNRIYELQRQYNYFSSTKEQKDQQINNTLSLYSAHSNEIDSIERPKLTKSIKQAQIKLQFEEILRCDSLILEQEKTFKEISQFQELGELNLNLPYNFRPKDKKSDFNSIQGNLKEINDKNVIGQMKKMKKKAQKMVQLQSQRQNNKYYRKTFDFFTYGPKLDHEPKVNPQPSQKQRRFRRIR